jgi:malonyl-CoA O-methyltransferase
LYGESSLSLTPLDRKAVRRSFERAACSYDVHAVLEREVESRLLERVEFFRQQPDRVLDLGCGTGSASRALGLQFKDAQIIALDWSTAMLEVSGRSNGVNPVRICADMHAIPLAAASADLVFSNLVLQWSVDLQSVFTEFRRVMKPGGMLVFTCYGPDTLSELRQAWQAVDDFPHVHDFPDMHDIGDMLLAAGFSEPVMDVERLTLEYRDVMSLLRELKGSGAQNAASHRFRGLTGRSRLLEMQHEYEQFRRNDRYPASYEIIFGASFAPAEGQPVRSSEGEIATFSIDALRSRSNTANTCTKNT